MTITIGTCPVNSEGPTVAAGSGPLDALAQFASGPSGVDGNGRVPDLQPGCQAKEPPDVRGLGRQRGAGTPG